ncbi:MAG: hypothetical protein F6K47_10525 [Symploca sp. SIO2E6]|nr:hypothetical protein [Symploca sp. SIO2E6]
MDVILHAIKPEDKNIAIGIISKRANEAIFPKTNKHHEYSRFQHLGKAGSPAHIDGVLAVVRRVQAGKLGQIDSFSELRIEN